MIKYENECVGCKDLGLPCQGDSCPNMNVPRYYCDKCGDECSPDDLYDVGGEMVCETCLLAMYDKISI